MASPAFQSPWHTPLEPSLDYEFTTELSPGVWKVYRRTDRVEYLAYDITDRLFTNPEQPWNGEKTELWNLMTPDNADGFAALLVRLLSHENLVCLIDIFHVRKTNFGGPYSRERWYALWDFCDAGNLGNLLTPTPDPSEPPAPADTKPAKTKHLPESLCWHVLTSVLKALAWLHDGTTTLETNRQLNYQVEMGGRDPDWQPILHRNITPENIFFMHPKRGEAYGICKLGNFAESFITGHKAINAEYEPDARQRLDPPQGPHGRYILAPPQGQDLQNLEDLETLRERDWQYADTYPPLSDQPYTLNGEYRALGEIIQAMMVPPQSQDHMRDIRSRSAKDNLANADYSEELRRFVQWLMEMTVFELLDTMELEAQYLRTSQDGPLITNCTSALYANAIRKYYEFRGKAGEEGKHHLFVTDAKIREVNEDNWKSQRAAQANDRMHAILDLQDLLFGSDPTSTTGNTGNAINPATVNT